MSQFLQLLTLVTGIMADNPDSVRCNADKLDKTRSYTACTLQMKDKETIQVVIIHTKVTITEVTITEVPQGASQEGQ